MVINKTRNTPQRDKILRYVQSVESHPTAEDVYKAIKKDMPTITLATVYRNLNFLAERGDIARLDINHEYRYDAHCESHVHFVCNKTGKIFDIHDKSIERSIQNKLKNTEFKPEKIRVIVHGTCS